MLDTIVSLLKESGVYAWEISDVKTAGWEFYFIRHALDQNRVRKVEHITVKVYQLIEDGKWLGSASCEIAPTSPDTRVTSLPTGIEFSWPWDKLSVCENTSSRMEVMMRWPVRCSTTA